MKKQNNNYRNQILRGLKRKYESILSRGGKCERCGYDKNISALEFHHKNPEEKDFQLDIRKFSNSNLDSLQKELDKCELLCANCHRELHHPDLDISNIKELLEEGKDKTSFSNRKEFGDVCPICGKRFKNLRENYIVLKNVDLNQKIIQRKKIYCKNYMIFLEIIEK